MLPQDAERSGGAAGGGLKTSTVCFKVASNVPSETGKLLKTISERSEDEGRDLSFTDLRAVSDSSLFTSKHKRTTVGLFYAVCWLVEFIAVNLFTAKIFIFCLSRCS